MSINLNNEEFNGKQAVAIFNNGEAGVVEDVKVSVEKKKADDKENAPDYKLNFTDASGASCNNSFWYVTEDTQYQTVAQQITKQGKVLKHLIHAVYGSDYQFPEYPNAKAMLDGVMKLLKEGLAKSGTFRIFANYGTKEYTKKYIQPRSWVPFIEPMSVDIANTRLTASDLDALARLQEDTYVSEGATATAGDDGDDW